MMPTKTSSSGYRVFIKTRTKRVFIQTLLALQGTGFSYAVKMQEPSRSRRSTSHLDGSPFGGTCWVVAKTPKP